MDRRTRMTGGQRKQKNEEDGKMRRMRWTE